MRALLVAAAVLALPLGAAAQDRGPSRDQVRRLLGGIEDTPSAEQWQRIGDGALPHLVALYDDPDEPPFVRLRAIGAAAAFPRPAVRTFLLAVARAPDQRDLFVREAVRALGRAFGEGALDDLRAFLDHPEPLAREAAADALGRIARPAAGAALRARLRVESTERVRRALRRALR